MNAEESPKLMSRAAACFTALILAMSLIPLYAAPAQAADPWNGQCGGCIWSLSADTYTLTISPKGSGNNTLSNMPHGSTDVPWARYKSNIKSVVIKDGVKANSAIGGMFSSCSNLTSVDLSGLDTTITRDMRNMFLGCGKLTTITGLDKISTANVTDMSLMFKDCTSLASVDVSKFNTSKVTRMDGMFQSCTALTSVDVSHFNTANVTNMTGMFSDCPKLTGIDVSGFDTRQVTTMEGMFKNCASLRSVDVSNFNTAKVGVMGDMFSGCSSLASLDVSKFNTSNTMMMNGMFYGCSELKSLDLSSFDTSKVRTMAIGNYSMFGGCDSLREVKLGSRFSFKGAGKNVLTTLPDAKWYSTSLKKEFTAAQIAQDRNNVADTYTTTRDPNNSGNGNNGGSNNGGSTSQGIVAIYRLYNPYSGEHLFTTDYNEKTTLVPLGWNDEGIGWYAPEQGSVTYRVFNPYSREHHYTTDLNERDTLVRIGWKYEGEAWHSSGSVELYRLFNPYETTFTHHYTKDINERNELVKIGWRYEGVGWYGITQ